MNDKSFPSSKAPTSKSENAWPGSVKFQKNGEHSFSKNLHPESDSTRNSAVREAKFAEFENETIQKQRQEMQLLIAELRSRDRELNEMVTGHRKQLMAWEQDRTRISALEEKCSRYERELHGRNEEIYSLTAKLHVIESEEDSRQMAIRNMQDQLNSVTEQHCLTSQRLNEAQEVNRGLGRTIKELKSTAGQHEQREQELFQLLSSKDRDLSEAASHIAEISAKLKRCEFQQQESHQGNADLKRQVSEWRNKHAEISRELDHAKKHNAKLEEFSAKQRSDVQQLRQQLITARSEVTMSNEREQRKEELLQLQKSKQDRTDAELAALRELCEIQQRDVSLLQSSLDTAKNLLSCRQKSFNQDRASVNYSHSQMLLPSQSVGSSFGDSPVRSYLKKSSSAGSKDTDASDSNINNHANLLLSRYSALRVSESSKVTSWLNPNVSVPISLERKSYDWLGGRLAEDLPEKQLAVELDESPTKDVMSSDSEKNSVVKAADRTVKMNFVESRVESSSSSSSHLVSASLAQSHVISPWEALSASTRAVNVLSPHGSWNNQKPHFATSSDKVFPGGSSNVEESDDDVVRDEVSMGDHVSTDEENVERNGMLVGEESKVEEGKPVGQDRWKRDSYVDNEGSRLKMNPASHVAALRGEKFGMSSVAEGESSSREGCVENGGVKGRSVVSNQDSSGNYAKDDDGSKHANICASNLSSTKDEGGFHSVNYCPSKLSSTKDYGGSGPVKYCPSELSSTKDNGGSGPVKYCSSELSSTKDNGGYGSVKYCPSKLSSNRDNGGSGSVNSCPSKLSCTTDEGSSHSGNYCPSELHSTKDNGDPGSVTYCPSKFSSSKDDGGSQSGNYCPSKMSSTKDESGFDSRNYCPSKMSSTKDESGSESGSYCPSRLSSAKGEGGSESGNYCPSRLSSVKGEGGSESGNYCPSRLSSTKDEAGSESGNYCPSRLSSSEHNGRSRSVSPRQSAVVEDKTNVSPQSLSKDDSDSQLFSSGFSSSKLPSLRNDMPKCDDGPELENSCPLNITILTGPELEKCSPSRVSSVSSVSQYSFQSLPANYGSIRKTSEVKFPIPNLRSGHWSGSCEKLSEAVGKDWARSCTWNSTIGDPTDNSALRQMSSFIGGVGRVGGQRDLKVGLKWKSEANASEGKNAIRQDFGKETYLQEQENVIEIVVERKYSAQSSGTISESSSHLDVFSDALA